jgi:hypothetical protein
MIDSGPNKCTTIPEGGGVGVWRACAPATPAAVANTAANILNFNLFLQRLICPARPDHRAATPFVKRIQKTREMRGISL